MMGRFIRIALSLVVLAGAGISPASAHPHVWVIMRSEIMFDKGAVAAIRHIWTFDDGYSAYLSQGLDKNGDGKLSREELSELAQTNVESLVDMNYFTVAKIGGKAAEVGAPKDYYLEENGKRLTLYFTLPLKKPATAKMISLEVFDPNFFVSFVPPENGDGMSMLAAPAGCKITVSKPKSLDADMSKQMTESFFQNLSPTSDFGAQFANRAVVACP